ncbi:MAG TPA: hypothetical protein G4O15_04970, partial [Dehalococcoidia bacterium]|nr:hypothetical protein [Dehalococcoidia bacterium]
GWVFQPVLDLNGDGVVDYLDVPASYDTDFNGIEEDEFLNWLNDNQYGYVFPLSLDTNDDGVVDYLDVPASYDLDDPADGIQQDEFESWLNYELSPATIEDYWVELWHYYDPDNPIWVFNIADLVYHNQVYMNNGIKNLQIRFYPVATTKFSETPVE